MNLSTTAAGAPEDVEEAARTRRTDPSIAPPPKPLSFGKDYTVPLHRIKLLEELNHHPLDTKIVFYEEPHIYTINDFPVQASVSGLAAEYESHFDKTKSLQLMKMARSQAWPRLQYSINPLQVDDPSPLHAEAATSYSLSTGVMMVDEASKLTLSSLTQGTMIHSGTSVVDALKKYQKKMGGESLVFYSFDRAMADDEIFKAWEDNGEDARNRGTEAHLQMEYWFNSEPARLDDGEVKVGLKFVRESLVPIGAKGYRTEWTIYGEEENIAGCIDLAVSLPSGNLYLVDWKRSEKLEDKMTSRSKMKTPFDHLDDCSGCAYAIQLSCYQYILEKYYNFKIEGRALCSIHPERPFTTSVPYMSGEVEFIMKRRREMHKLRVELAQDDQFFHLTCSETKRIVIRAVFSNGRLFEEKVATLKGIEYQFCPWTTERAANLIEAKLPPIVIPPSLKVSWKKLFPNPSDDLFAY